MEKNKQLQQQLRRDRQEMILGILLAVGVVTTAIVAPNALQLFKYIIPRNSRDAWGTKRSLSLLEKRKFVESTIKNGESYYSLTTQGRKRALQYQLKLAKITPKGKWDGLWYLVMFDVPEDKKMARRAVNLALKKLGCVQYQKSVFITPYPCKKEIDFVGEAFDIRDHIRVVTAKEVEGVESIKKAFKL